MVIAAGPARWFALAAVIGPILFTLAWLILGQLSPPYYGPLFTVAEHSGVAVPIDWLALGWTRPFMNTAFVLCGLLLLGGIIGIFDAIREMGTLARWTCTLLLALSPLGLILCGIIPVDSMFLYGSPDKITHALFVPSTALNHYQLHGTYFVATSLFPPFANPLHTLGFLLAVASPVLPFLSLVSACGASRVGDVSAAIFSQAVPSRWRWSFFSLRLSFLFLWRECANTDSLCSRRAE